MPEKNLDEQGCAYGNVTRTILKALEKKFDVFYNNDFKEVKKTLKEINDKLNNPRPSWAVSIIITLLSSITTGLVVLKIVGG